MSDADSLEQTIREENTTASLPVLTVSASRRLRDKQYRETCAERLVEFVMDLENLCGAGRLFLP